jgi:hypothetical protein
VSNESQRGPDGPPADPITEGRIRTKKKKKRVDPVTFKKKRKRHGTTAKKKIAEKY